MNAAELFFIPDKGSSMAGTEKDAVGGLHVPSVGVSMPPSLFRKGRAIGGFPRRFWGKV